MTKLCYKYRTFSVRETYKKYKASNSLVLLLLFCSLFFTGDLMAKHSVEKKQNIQDELQVSPDELSDLFFTRDLIVKRHYVEKIRKINKEFDVNPDATLRIENKFGTVHIDTWDQNVIEMEIEIKVQDRKEDRAERKLEEIDIRIEASASSVEAYTELDGDGNRRGFGFSLGDLSMFIEGESDRNKVEINYKIKAPITANLELINHYGNTYISDVNGNTELDIKYGQLRADRLLGAENEIELGYGHAEIEEMRFAEIDIKYSELEVERCEKMELYSKYTNVELEQVDYLESDVRYGKLSVESVISMEGELKYTALEIGELLNDLDLEIGYGPRCEIEYIPMQFEFIEIEANFTSVHLDFEEGSSFDLEAETSYGKMDIDHSLKSSRDIDRDRNGNSHNINAQIGEHDTSKKVRIDVSYGNLVIDED